jgi:hypothetical protein
LTADRAGRIQLFASTNLAAFTNWSPLANPLVLTNGLLRVDGLSISNFSRRFFRAVESP